MSTHVSVHMSAHVSIHMSIHISIHISSLMLKMAPSLCQTCGGDELGFVCMIFENSKIAEFYGGVEAGIPDEMAMCLSA